MGKNIGVTIRSVMDNPQRAVIINSSIKLINKFGRKNVTVTLIPIQDWVNISTFGNIHYNQKKFIEKLNTVVADTSPESACLKERILDAQILAINSVIEKYILL